jgi:hypothetical protein
MGRNMPLPALPYRQRVEELMVRCTDAGPGGQVGQLEANDLAIARTAWVRAEAGWMIDALVPLLPPEAPFAGRVDELTCAVGGTPDFLRLTPTEAYERVEKMLGDVTALMHAYSPNLRRRFEVWQIHEVHTSGRQSAIKRYQVTVSASDGMARLKEPVSGNQNRAAALLQLANRDEQVRDALSLLQTPEPSWGAVYDALKFVEDSPVAQGRKKKIKKYGGTASWHRHLGERGRPAKPKNPPDLVQARAFAFGLLREWLDLKVAEYLGKS